MQTKTAQCLFEIPFPTGANYDVAIHAYPGTSESARLDGKRCVEVLRENGLAHDMHLASARFFRNCLSAIFRSTDGAEVALSNDYDDTLGDIPFVDIDVKCTDTTTGVTYNTATYSVYVSPEEIKVAQATIDTDEEILVYSRSA